MATASPGSSFDGVIRRTEARFKGCPDTRAMLKRTALDVSAPKPRSEVPPWGIGAFLGGLTLVALVVALLVAGGCVPVEAVRQAELEAAIMHGHANLETSPPEARAIGAKGERAWRAQHRALTGDDVPQAISEGWAPIEPEAPR